MHNKLALTQPKVSLITFCLPQFHQIPENDLWWVRGDKELMPCATARPRFEGYHQSHLTSELALYDLCLPENRQSPAGLVCTFGFGDFCYGHYCFKGKLLLERAFEEVLKSVEPDFIFYLV
jgi:hypothetical protein